MQNKTITILCSFGVIALHSIAAQAQKTEGALQLALGTDVLTYDKASTTVEAPLGDQKSNISTFRWGFAQRNGINLEGGYGIGDSLVIGGFLALGGWSQTTKPDVDNANENTESDFAIGIAPKIDYMFMPDSNIRPFIGGAVGLTYQSAKQETHVALTNSTTTVSDVGLTGLLLMARAGVRCFLTHGFSIDPAFTLGWIPTASGSYQAGANSVDVSAHQFSVGLSLAASGWVGL